MRAGRNDVESDALNDLSVVDRLAVERAIERAQIRQDLSTTTDEVMPACGTAQAKWANRSVVEACRRQKIGGPQAADL